MNESQEPLDMVGSNVSGTTKKNHMLIVKGLVLSLLVVSSAIPLFLIMPEASPAFAQPSVIETITGLPDAADVAYDPVHEMMYVTRENSGNVYIIDVNTNTETSNSPITLPSGSVPNEIAYDPEHGRMYVTDFNTHNGYVINTNNVMETPVIIPFGSNTGGIAYNPDNQMMYVAVNNCGCIKMIDTDDNTIDPISISLPLGLGTPWGIAYDPDHQRMYVTRLGVGYVDIIDTTTNTLDTTHGSVDVGGNPFGIAYDPVHQTMQVTNSASDSVSVIDTDTGMDPNEVITTISGITHANGIAYDPVNEKMYVPEWLAILSSNVKVIDTNTNAQVGDPIPLGSLPEGIAYEPVHGRMYVANFGSDSVSVIQTPQEVDPATAMEDLITDIRTLDGVNFFVKLVLISQLRLALYFVNNGNDVFACGIMNTFIGSVNRLEDRGRLTEAQADELLQQAQVIKDAIGCITSTTMQTDEADMTSTPSPQSSANLLILVESVDCPSYLFGGNKTFNVYGL